MHKEREAEVLKRFAKVLPLGKFNRAKKVANPYFFETAVRIHRAGEGAAFTAFKPAGLGAGPVMPVAEKLLKPVRPMSYADS